MTILRVLISDSWPDQAEAAWVVLDKGQVTASGNSGPGNWPKTDRTEAILAGSQVGWAVADVPQAKPREQLRALPFALEDQLMREPDSQHFTPLGKEGTRWSVLIIARERLRRLVAQFTALGRPLDAVWSALACMPVTADSWTLAADGTHWLLRCGTLNAYVDDAPHAAGEVPAVIGTLFAQAQASGQMPARLTSLGIPHTELAPLSRYGTGFAPEATWDWHIVPPELPNLLHGEFLSEHARGKFLRALRPAIYLVVAVLLLDLIIGVGSAMLRQRDLNDMRKRLNQVAQTQLPGRALQDPVVQLHRELQTQRQRHGYLAEDDALALLSELAVALGSDATGAIQALHYESGALIVTLGKPLDMSALQARLDTRGIAASIRGGTTLSLQRKPA
ncbi:MAG: type II secretion system protein GspL [Rhodocyclaceae bacterium]